MLKSAAVLTVLSVLWVSPVFATSQASLQKEAKVSMEEARRIALHKVPQGKIASEELERESGKLIYSFDMKTAKPGVTEVNIDAMTGKILGVHHETPASERTEKKQEQKEKLGRH